MSSVSITPKINETTEREREQDLTHYDHPTDSTINWCGKPKQEAGFGPKIGKSPKSCPICEDLLRRFGATWWWDTHRRHYESQCHVHHNIAFHNCEGAC